MQQNKLDIVRIALYTTLAVLGFFLIQAWNNEHPAYTPTSAPMTVQTPGNERIPTLNTPTTVAQSAATPAPAQIAESAKGQIVKVTTDLLEVSIDTRGGDIIETRLLKYPESLNAKIPFVLLNDDPKTRYLAESGLLSKEGPDTSSAQALYTVDASDYSLSPDANNLTVNLKWQGKNGLTVTKQLTFTRGSYEINVAYLIDNAGSTPWDGKMYAQLLRTDTPPKGTGGVVNLTTFFGAAVSSPEKPFEKITFSDMRSKGFTRTSKDGWAAMVQHYFISAFVPAANTESTYYSKVTPQGLYTIGLLGPELSVAPGAKATTSAKLYLGPSIASELAKTAPTLKLTIDYGIFWIFSNTLFLIMKAIYDFVGNWGWSIVLVTILIKLLFYPLSAKSYRSMSGLKKLQPRIEMLKERYGDDRQKLTQATLELYRQEKVNPMSGCLPILIQIPVFIGLYWVLVESVELRQAPFILWIHDLSQADPYYILPVLMTISMFLQQRLNPPPPDPLQAKVMLAMPFIFGLLFANFPAGLMLYWFVNNTLSFLQQWYIMQNVNKEVKVSPAKAR